MMDLNAKFEEFVEKLNNMSSTEFDKMLIRCGIERIKPSIESDYVRCLRKTFLRKISSRINEEYVIGSAFKEDAYGMYNNFDLDNFGQGAA